MPKRVIFTLLFYGKGNDPDPKISNPKFMIQRQCLYSCAEQTTNNRWHLMMDGLSQILQIKSNQKSNQNLFSIKTLYRVSEILIIYKNSFWYALVVGT
jgi:hypothetical protein